MLDDRSIAFRDMFSRFIKQQDTQNESTIPITTGSHDSGSGLRQEGVYSVL